MNLSMKIRFIWAAIGISAGIMAGTVFAIQYKNYAVLALGLFSSVCATFLFYVHLAYYKSWMFTWTKTKVQMVVVINSIICVLALFATVLFIIWSIVVAEPLVSQGNNKWMIAVWSWMTSKWTMASAIYANRYSRKVMLPILDVDGDIPSGYESVYIRGGHPKGGRETLAPALNTTATQTDY